MVVYGILILAIIWGYYNLSERKPVVYSGQGTPAAQPPTSVVSTNDPPFDALPADVNGHGSNSNWGKDPFYHRRGRATAVVSTGHSAKVERAALHLMGIMFREQGAKALINGQVVSIGDTIAGHTITEIAPAQVSAAYNNRTIILRVGRETP